MMIESKMVASVPKACSIIYKVIRNVINILCVSVLGNVLFSSISLFISHIYLHTVNDYDFSF